MHCVRAPPPPLLASASKAALPPHLPAARTWLSHHTLFSPHEKQQPTLAMLLIAAPSNPALTVALCTLVFVTTVFAPPLLYLLICAHGVRGAVSHIALCAVVQVSVWCRVVISIFHKVRLKHAE